MATLTPDQIANIYANRPDVQQYYANPVNTKKYGSTEKAVSNWWNKIGQSQSPNALYSAQANAQVPTLTDLASQRFQFDPNQYLPGIQQTAESIYAPQRAQLEALRQLQSSTTEQTRIKTNADFDKQLQSAVEAINSRGAFFSGGGLKAQGNIEQQRGFALQDINLQDQASQAGFLAQQAGLSASQAEYVQQRLTGAENSAYSRWSDNRNFLMGLNQAQRQALESDRAFNEDVRQFGLQYALDKKRLKMQSDGSSDKTVTMAYTGLPTQKTIDMNYNTGGGGGGFNTTL